MSLSHNHWKSVTLCLLLSSSLSIVEAFSLPSPRISKVAGNELFGDVNYHLKIPTFIASSSKLYPLVKSNLEARGLVFSATTTDEDSMETSVTAVFDFSDTEKDAKSIESFERIDDAIMGGISTSTLRDVSNRPYASWSGVCREDGGGFCGMRTLPFVKPIDVTNTDGIFIDCRLASDNEPERRIWKMTVRTDSSRGEQVYQSQFQIPASNTTEIESGDGSWKRIKVPFDSFQLVRGPRLIIDGPKLNTTGGLFQIGMTMSKFLMRENTTTLENFRPGFFELQIERIGLFKNDPVALSSTPSSMQVDALSKKEAARKRPIIFRTILPVVKFLFSESAKRRKQAMKILMEKRDLSWFDAIMFAIKNRAKGSGMPSSILRSSGIIAVDAFRIAVKQLLKICLLLPLNLLRKTVLFVKKNIFRMEIKQLPAME